MKKKCSVGGQAVIEGVMMRGEKGVATAVRTTDGNIEVDLKQMTPYTKRNKFLALPFIRGFVSLIESLVIGIETLNYSASFFEDEEEESKFEQYLNKIFKEKSNSVIIGITLIISFMLSILIFFFVPTGLANFFKRFGLNTFGLNVIEGMFRVTIFLTYLYLISKMDEINRLFQYHGAEHKTIFCYENDEELTVENVKKYERFHPRCGTNFLFLVMIVSILLFSVTGWKSIWERLFYRILLLPLVSGITYEMIKWLGRSEGSLAKIIAAPGLKLQMLTTREPDDSQLEVAIASLKAAEGIKDPEKNIGELLEAGKEILKEVGIDTFVLDSQILLGKVLEKDKIYLITHREEFVSTDKEKEFLELINLRKNKMPIKYMLESCEFMGMDFYVREGVLIPRPDTEILVEEVLGILKENKLQYICDLCCGSGAVGLSLAYHNEEIKVDLLDISEDAKDVTEKNIVRFNLGERAKFIKSNLFKEILQKEFKYDLIVSNPPYIRRDVIPTLMEDVKLYEPHLALDGGEDGLEFYRDITEQSLKVIKNKGVLAFEIGHDQGEEVSNILISNGYENVRVVKDLAGLDRVVLGNLK